MIKESGAEIIRLWVSMTEFTEELRVSKEILTRVVDVYRKLRNTCRILVANLYDFDPATDMVPLDQLDEVDRFALARYARAAQRMMRAYEEYDFSTVSQTLNTLATVDLSAFYVDVTKDRMYTLGAKSHERRSTQTVMYLISDGLARLLAPDSAGDRRSTVAHMSRDGARSRCTWRSSRTSRRSQTRRCSRRGSRCSACAKR